MARGPCQSYWHTAVHRECVILLYLTAIYGTEISYIDENGDGQYDEGDEITGRIENNSIYKGKDPNVAFFKGMFQSFGDAPNGISEELQEVTWALGAEYWFRDVFAITRYPKFIK